MVDYKHIKINYKYIIATNSSICDIPIFRLYTIWNKTALKKLYLLKSKHRTQAR